MKKIILFIFLILNVGISNSQWKTAYFYDEFKQPTKQSYNYIYAPGVFTNLVTKNGELICKFILDKKNEALSIYVYENKDNLSVSMESTWEEILIKKPNEIVITIKKVFFSKHGFLMFTGDNFKKVMNILEKPGTYYFNFHRNKLHSEAEFDTMLTLN